MDTENRIAALCDLENERQVREWEAQLLHDIGTWPCPECGHVGMEPCECEDIYGND